VDLGSGLDTEGKKLSISADRWSPEVQHMPSYVMTKLTRLGSGIVDRIVPLVLIYITVIGTCKKLLTTR
jgi:hypothetical protein